ncbi:MAG: hypothetical protein NTV23_00520 [Propionibacteriales bacterium]|nr:hypothetical protein [Propionibacteriales bacterium]
MDELATLGSVRAALDEHDWDSATGLLAGIDADHVDACELRAQAAYGSGDLEGCLSAWEHQYQLLVATEENILAARAACMVAMYLLIDTGLMAPIRGWLARAEKLLADVEEPAPPHVLVAMIRGYERFFCGDPAAARPYAEKAVTLGRALDVMPGVVMSSICLARLDILEGRVDDGLAALDEVALMLASDVVDPLTCGMAYCELICAAQGMLLSDRAQEWTDVMARWSSTRAFGGLNGRCLVHRAELLRISGPADEAERTAEQACTELRPWMRREYGWPLVELGAIRLRRGDLVGAEEALIAAHERAWCPMPALALLRLEQDDADAAAALIAEAIARPIEIPWKERPPISELRVFPFYAAQCEIAHARGDRATAASAAGTLRRVADQYGGNGLAAVASLATARSAVLHDDVDTAVREASRAVATWSESGAPFEVGQARLVLAEGLEASGNPEAARLERAAAAEAFRSFGAPRWEARARAQDVRPPHAATEAAFTITGSTVTITFSGRTSHLRDLTGLRTLRRLLAEPGREFHVLDLVATSAGVTDRPEPGFTLQSGMPVIDEQARAAYKRRLDEIDEDLAVAEAEGDADRMELARIDRDFLARELAAAVGLGGRERRTGDPAERARTSVARSLRYSLTALAEHDPTLAAHLRLHLRTGLYCAYQPDPVAPVTWKV